MAQVGLAGPFEYDEAEWTPSLTFGGAAVGMTYLGRLGYYIRTGNMVVLFAALSLSAKGASAGAACIEGLPYKTINDWTGQSAMALYFKHITFTGQFQGITELNTFKIVLEEVTEAGAHSALNNADFADNSVIILSGIYRTG